MGTSAAPAGGSGGNNGGGAPPNEPGTNAGSGGAGAENGGGSGTPAGTNAGASGFERGKLNPILRGMEPEQINEVFDTLFASVRRSNEAPPPPKQEPPKPRTSPEELKERFDPSSDKFDPKGAVAEIVSENYGGLITDISRRANEGVKAAVRAAIPDFAEHEKEIDEVLKGVDPNLINQGVMVDTYLRVRGAKALKETMNSAKKPPATLPPTPRSDERATEDKLSQEEENVARVMFRNAADPIAEYRKVAKMIGDSGVTVKVPGEK